MSDLRDRILNYDDSQREIVSVPQWDDVEVEVRSITAGQRGRLLREVRDEEGNIDAGKLSIMLVIATSHDPASGERLFREKDYDLLGEKSPAAIEHLMEVAARLSALSEEEVTDIGPSSSPAMTASTQTEGSPSTSPSGSGTPIPTG